MREIDKTESFELILNIHFTCECIPNSSTLVSVFYKTWMIYVICVYVVRHSPIDGIHPPIFGHSEFYIVAVNVNLHDVMI